MADITAKTYANILKYGLQASYEALATKDASVLYFCTDTGKIYRGTVDFSNSVIAAASKPEKPVVGKVYVLSGTGTVEYFNGTAWVEITPKKVTSIDAASTDATVPSAKAVYTAINNAMTGTDVVKAIAQKMVDSAAVIGTLEYTTGDGSKHDVTIQGMAKKPTYDSATRKFTFPVVGDDALEVELGTDIFIDKNANNRYENGNLYIYLNDGTESKDPTELVIPVTGLITDYFGDDTNSIVVNVDSSTHKVTAELKLRANTETFTNALKVSDVEGAEGVYVDFSEIDSDISGLDARLDVLEGDENTAGSVKKAVKDAQDTLQGEIDVINGADTVAGSIANQVATAKSDLQGKIDVINGTGEGSIAKAVADESTVLKNGVIKDAQDAADAAQAGVDKLNGTAAEEGSVAKAVADESTVLKNGVIKAAQEAADAAQDAADAAQADADQNAADIAALAAAVAAWGTF